MQLMGIDTANWAAVDNFVWAFVSQERNSGSCPLMIWMRYCSGSAPSGKGYAESKKNSINLFINHLKCDIMAQIEEKQTVEMTAEEKSSFEAFRKEKAKKRGSGKGESRT